MRTYKIYLLRHGLTQGNIDGKYIGVTDTDICLSGLQELKQLSSDYEYPNIGKLYSSPLKRCLQTAVIIYPHMTINTVDKIKEYDFGIYENKSMPELKDDKDFLDWIQNGMEKAPEGGEDMQNFAKRVKEGFDIIIKDMMNTRNFEAAVITHGGVIMTILAMCGLPKRKSTQWTVGNGKGYSLLIDIATWSNANCFEVCDALPYGKESVTDARLFDLIDIEQLDKLDSNSDSDDLDIDNIDIE